MGPAWQHWGRREGIYLQVYTQCKLQRKTQWAESWPIFACGGPPAQWRAHSRSYIKASGLHGFHTLLRGAGDPAWPVCSQPGVSLGREPTRVLGWALRSGREGRQEGGQTS